MPIDEVVAPIVGDVRATTWPASTARPGGWPAAASGGLDLLAWGQKYLPDHFRRPPSNMHRWLAEQLDAARTSAGHEAQRARPARRRQIDHRHALPCRSARPWSAGNRTSGSSPTPSTRPAPTWRTSRPNCSRTARLAEDFPEAVGRGLVWRDNSIVLRNGVTIEAFGTGQRIRGRRRRQHRPTLIVCDDLQNDGHIRSALQREHSRSWFHGTLMKAGTARTNVVNLATALHREALAMELHRTPGWTSRVFKAIVRWPENMSLWQQWEAIYTDLAKPRYKTAARKFYEQHRPAMDAGAILLWPEEEDLYTLMCMRVESGRTAFEREKQNSPVNPDLCEWPEAYFDETIWFEAWPANLVVKTMALDPSKGSDARRGDYSALVLLGVDRQGMLYVEADLARRPTPQIVADGDGVVPPLSARRVRRRGQPVSGPAGRRVRGRVPPAGHFGRPARADRKPHGQAGPHPPAGAVSVVAPAAVQGRQSRHAAAGRAASGVPHRRSRRRPRRPGNGAAPGGRTAPRPRDQRRPGQPAAGGMRGRGSAARR